MNHFSGKSESSENAFAQRKSVYNSRSIIYNGAKGGHPMGTRSINKKTRILKIYDYIKEVADEHNPVSTADIINMLKENGISAERRTVYADIRLLRESGYEIGTVKKADNYHYYWVMDTKLHQTEVRIILDALRAAVFISPGKTDALIESVVKLNDDVDKYDLLKSPVCFNIRKHTNEHIYYTIDKLEAALKSGRQVSFRYYRLDENRKKVFGKDGEKYYREPLALIYHEDNYYLCCYSQNHGIDNYRIDRIEDAEIEDIPVSAQALAQLPVIEHYTEQVFKMFTGDEAAVRLRFRASALSAVYDKFGENIKIRKLGEDCYETVHVVQLSPVFYSWVFQFGTKMKIIGPESVKKRFIQFVDEVRMQY